MTTSPTTADLIADIIAAHANGGITAEQALESYKVTDIIVFSSMLKDADPGAYDGLAEARRNHRPPSDLDARNEALTADADPATNTAIDELAKWMRVVDRLDAQNHAEAEPPPAEGWPIASAADINAVLDGTFERPRPELMIRTDGMGMMYRGRVHSLAGEPGGGKTWLALYAVKQVLDGGGRCVFLDFEDRIDTAVRRLVQLGCGGHAILDGLTYTNPTLAIKGGGLPINIVDASVGADLVVIDSMGEALAHSDLNQNDDGEVRDWMANTARRLANAGACVLILDHVSKDADNRGRWAIGSQRKLAAIDGIAYVASTITAASHSQAGHVIVKCSKDRLGNFQHGTNVADIHINPIGSDVEIVINPPKETTTESGEHLLTGYMEKVSRFLETDDDGWSKAAIHGSVGGKKDHINTAIRQLQDGGYIDVVKGDRNTVIHRSKMPYREPEIAEPVDLGPPRPHLGPTSAPTGSKPSELTSAPRPLPLRGAEVKCGGAGHPENTQKQPHLGPDLGPAPIPPRPDDDSYPF